MNNLPILPPITGKKPAPPITNPHNFTSMTLPTPFRASPIQTLPTPMRASPIQIDKSMSIQQQIPTKAVLAPIPTIKSAAEERVTYYPNPDSHRPKITRPKTANKRRGRPPIGGTKTKRKTNKRKNNKTKRKHKKTNKRKTKKTNKRKTNKIYK